MNKNDTAVYCGCGFCKVLEAMPDQMTGADMAQLIARVFVVYGLTDETARPVVEAAREIFLSHSERSRPGGLSKDDEDTVKVALVFFGPVVAAVVRGELEKKNKQGVDKEPGPAMH